MSKCCSLCLHCDADGGDHVVERRRTVPKPYLIYRMLRPVVADGGDAGERPPDPEELAFACDVQGQDVQADVQAVLDAAGQPMAMVLFQPGLRAETEWELRYRSPRLWDPLRRTGRDTLSWATATFEGRHRPTLTDLTVCFVFPPDWSEVEIAEQGGYGATHVERLESGQTRVGWHHGGPDAPPIAPTYEWVLRAARPG